MTFPPIVSGFGYSPLPAALWRADAATGLQMRNLSLGQASGGVLTGRHFRTGGAPAAASSALGDAQSPLAFVFLLQGKAVLRESGREPVQLQALDSACRFGAGTDCRWELSHDAEVVEILGGPGSAAVLGNPPGAASWRVTRDGEESYVAGDGPRKFFRYRDLGLAAATGRRIHIHVVRATQAVAGGTGWHSHSMGQLFYVLRGWADLEVEKQPWVHMCAGDAMCVAPRMAHNVPAFSADYLVLEMCIPADYDTIDVEGER